jgi:four helix bundle protein
MEKRKEIHSHRDLLVWQKAMDLYVESCRSTNTFPRHELFGLTSQLRRTAFSIPANIAEGKGRRRTRAYLSFLDVSYGSLMELDTAIEAALRMNYVTLKDAKCLFDRIAEIGRMLNGLISALERNLEPE